MKTFFNILVLLFTCTFSYGFQKNTTNYSILKKDKEHYTIQYNDGKAPLDISIKKSRDSILYTVNNNELKAIYIGSVHGFGLRMNGKLHKELKELPIKSRINSEQIYKQSILSKWIPSTERSLHLIAGFFPDLLKLDEKQVVNEK